MHAKPVNILAIVVRYQALLQRYAGWLVKEPAVAEAIVKVTIEEVYEINEYREESAELRRLFKTYTLQMCRHWLRLQNLPGTNKQQHD